MNSEKLAVRRWFRAATLLLLTLTALLSAPSAPAVSAQELFVIERSTNRNAVVYTARIGDDGELDHKNPVSAHWVLHEAGGKREELTYLERSLAYGFSISEDQAGILLRLVAFEQRQLRLVRRGARYLASVRIAGKASHLKRIWVRADSGLLGPQVRYIELEGNDATTGERVTERIVREPRSARRPR